MMTIPSETALFRLSILGPLVSRSNLEHGELKLRIQEIASRDYNIPHTNQRTCIAEKTIEGWYYAHRRGDIDALEPKARIDKGVSKLPLEIRERIIEAKKENARRSIDQIIVFLEGEGVVAKGSLSRSSVHRLLQRCGISRMVGSASMPEEYRAFESQYAGDIWYGDVMHGPSVPVDGRMRKVYLVSLMDDASRLITHSAFCLGEKALDIENVLKQAVLKRGLPHKLVLDNGSAYRSGSLKGICARLGIHMIYCRPYAPEGKGKLERWHRTFRQQFLSELDTSRIQTLADLNARLWAWVESVYHHRVHSSLKGKTPLERYQRDLPRIRALGSKALKLDEIFYHRARRKVRRDGTIAWDGKRFEVPYELVGKYLYLVIEPHAKEAVRVENEEGEILGGVTPLDLVANCNRKRVKPKPDEVENVAPETSMVERAHECYNAELKGDK
ncbi:MAG: DDE-type integrase/transposase/recombinase [Mariprofundales bacterium]|nr:DDE-type integrase/transposase/recombinase [Mariprofundales bacterium]